MLAYAISTVTVEHNLKFAYWTRNKQGAYLLVCPVQAQAHLFILLPYQLFTSLLGYLIKNRSIICPNQGRPNMALVFFVCLCCSIFYGCMFAFVVLVLVFSTKPRDWLGRTSPNWPILCRVGCKIIAQWIGESIVCLYIYARALLSVRCLVDQQFEDGSFLTRRQQSLRLVYHGGQHFEPLDARMWLPISFIANFIYCRFDSLLC